jgi:ABC-2 type transport system permease protein
VTLRVTVATARRVLEQLRADRRTTVLLIVVPPMLVTLLKYVLHGDPRAFQRVGPPLVGLFPFLLMFVTTSITMLRERTTGTLERLMTMPLAKLDLLLGYGIAFGLVAIVQAAVTAGIAVGALGLDVAGSTAGLIALAVATGLLGMSLGLFVSAFATTEFQAMQFMPAFVLPQILLCGVLVPRSHMLHAFDVISYALPLTYAFDALERVASFSTFDGTLARDIAITVGLTFVALALGATTLRRRTP